MQHVKLCVELLGESRSQPNCSRACGGTIRRYQNGSKSQTTGPRPDLSRSLGNRVLEVAIMTNLFL